MKVVLDTNVLVSALISPHGAPALILRLILQGELKLVADSRILDEYREVLMRPRFGLPRDAVETVLAALREEAIMAPACTGNLSLSDADDLPFLETALAARADALITGNIRHFPPSRCHGIVVLSPAAFLARRRERSP